MGDQERSGRLLPLEIRVRKTLKAHGMVEPGDRVLAAVSGGADSVALLLCLRRLAPGLGFSLAVAHLNHRIRGAEGDADEDFVRRLSADLGLQCVCETIEVREQAARAKRNLEELAREKRYEFLGRAARATGANRIAAGHTLNDQAETVLFRMIRGSGVEGLSAIHPVVGGTVIRPLLECSRDFILEYLRRKGAGYREDSTNRDLRHARNRIRLELVPYLEKHLNPRLIETLSREARQSREMWSFMEAEARRALETSRRRSGEDVVVELGPFSALHPALQQHVVRLALKECLGSIRGLTSRHLEAVLTLCRSAQSGDEIRILRGGVAIRQFDTLVLRKRPAPEGPSFSRSLEIPGGCRVAEAGVTFRATLCPTPDPKTLREKSAARAYLDPSSLPGRLTVRSREPGDRYGGPGHRKVKKLLIEGRVPLSRRGALPMVADGADVVWIPGFRPAGTHAARPDAPECVLIEVLPARSPAE